MPIVFSRETVENSDSDDLLVPLTFVIHLYGNNLTGSEKVSLSAVLVIYPVNKKERASGFFPMDFLYNIRNPIGLIPSTVLLNY